MFKPMLPLRSAFLVVGFIGGVVLPVAGSAQSSTEYEAPCTTKASCDAQADARELRQRQDNWRDMVKQNQEADAFAHQMRAEARAQTERGRLTRLQEVMRRRREAAAAAAN